MKSMAEIVARRAAIRSEMLEIRATLKGLKAAGTLHPAVADALVQRTGRLLCEYSGKDVLRGLDAAR